MRSRLAAGTCDVAANRAPAGPGAAGGHPTREPDWPLEGDMGAVIPLVLLLCVPAAAQPDRDDEAARAVVDQAVRAHGGVAGINKLRVANVTFVMQGDLTFLGLPGAVD